MEQTQKETVEKGGEMSEERRNELFEIVNAHQSSGQKSPADV